MSPVTILIVDKTGTIKETTLKNYDESELYKKAGFKTGEGFKCHAEWNINDVNDKNYSVSVFGKTTGKANQENKYDFPPPIDNTLFFGSCIIVNKNENGSVVSVTEDEWESIYDYLFGGFEDIGDEDSDDDDDDDEDDGLPRTKDGYVKDDFVVDDDEFDEEEEDEDEEDEVDDDDEEVYTKKSKSKKQKVDDKKKGKVSDKKTTKKPLVNVFTTITESENYLGCTSELVEEEYI
jgi:hypothetical protein